jgi:hypothetical protein
MDRDWLKEVKELGIVGIKAGGIMTTELIDSAITSTKELFSHIDMGVIAKEIASECPDVVAL